MQSFQIVIHSYVVEGGPQSFREAFFRLCRFVNDALEPAASKPSLDDYCMVTFVEGHRCIMTWEGVRGLAIELGIIELDGTPVQLERHINLAAVDRAFLLAHLNALRDFANGQRPRFRSALGAQVGGAQSA